MFIRKKKEQKNKFLWTHTFYLNETIKKINSYEQEINDQFFVINFTLFLHY